ncbi:MAG: GntR family transcriptional regulator [Sedimentisphaeraceae bacterium JB056]
MILNIDNHSGVPVYRQLVSQISEMILTGQLASGEQLMSVRELAAMIKANPMTVSKAYSMLERDGLLERRRGIGLFVRSSQGGKKEKDMRHQIMDDAVKTAARTALRLGFSEKEAMAKLKQALAKYGDTKDE